MGKKPNIKPAKNTKSKVNNLWMVAGAAIIMIGIVWFTMRTSSDSPGQSEAVNAAKAPVSLIATLSPDGYTGKARSAYQAAKEIPEILAELPCFCGCKDGLGHRNNLYCFADEHGSICDLCQTIALNAQEMHRKGMPTSQIRDNIVSTYGSAH